MKTHKAILALILILGLFCTLFAACTESGTSPTPAGSDNAEAPGNANSSTPSAPTPEEDDEEMATVEFWYWDICLTGEYAEHVEEEINKITEEKINTHVNISWYDGGSYATNFSLAMSGGETIDLCQACRGTEPANLYSQNMILEIGDLLREYAPEAYALMEPYLGGWTFDGGIYAVPAYRNYCNNGYIIMRKDILDELGLTDKARNMTTWSEYEEILAAVTNAYTGTGLYAVTNGSGATILGGSGYYGDEFSRHRAIDNLGDQLDIIYNDDGALSLKIENDVYHNAYIMARKWADLGYVYPEAAVCIENGDDLMKMGIGFSNIQDSEEGCDISKGNTVGYELVCTKFYTGMIKNSALTTFGVLVPITAAEPEAAMKFLNLLYTDADIMNMLTWGVEEEDYNLVDGQVKLVEKPHYNQADFLLGNNLLLTPLYGNGVDYYERVQNILNTADVSPFVGFALDTSGMDLVISQVSAVKDQYNADMGCGNYTEQMYQEYLQKLEVAGVYDYIEACQEQLDAWLASK